MKSMILITGNRGFFGQTRKPWVSLDVARLKQQIENAGRHVEQFTFSEIINREAPVSNRVIFYAFSQKENIRSYIRDMAAFQEGCHNFLIPSLELLRCHENKGYQELYKKKIGLETLKSFYFSGLDDMSNVDLEFPCVLKTTDGSNGKGVYLIRDLNALSSRVKKLVRQDPLVQLDLVRRRYFRRKKQYKEYPDYSNETDYLQYQKYILKEKNFILQEFVPNLEHDFRVLALGDKYYVIKRHNRPNDFRASGAKKFDRNFTCDPKLLDYARSVYETFDTPFLSMDICPYQKGFALLEYQALHFGINVICKNKGYYRNTGQGWAFQEGNFEFEKDLAEGLIAYLDRKGY